MAWITSLLKIFATLMGWLRDRSIKQDGRDEVKLEIAEKAYEHKKAEAERLAEPARDWDAVIGSLRRKAGRK